MIADSVEWEQPQRVSRHATRAEAQQEATRLNLQSMGANGRAPVYFVERIRSDLVLDTERSQA